MENAHPTLTPDSLVSDGGKGGEHAIEIYLAGLRPYGQWVSCALVAPQVQAWTYIEQMDPPGAAPLVEGVRTWADELRKVPRTLFVKSERELLDLVVTEICRLCELLGEEGRNAVPMLRVDGSSQLAAALGMQASHVQIRPAVARQFCEQSNGGRRVSRQHALLQALELAVSDGKARHPLLIEEITRFELLLGTKNAQSMRAWLRRRAAPTKAAGRSAPTQVAPAGV
jgi:hypothetical protein